MSRWMKYTLLALIVILLAAIPLARRLRGGSMEGVITDEHGFVQGALVQVDNVKNGATLRAVSNATGHYKLESVRAGRYSLWVQEPMRHDPICVQTLVLERGQSIRKDFRLKDTDPETIQNCEGGLNPYGAH